MPKQGKWDRKSSSKGVQCVKTGKMTWSLVFGISRTTLSRRLLTMDLESPAFKPTVLSKEGEYSLVSHILKMEGRAFGLTILDVCKLAYSIIAHSGRKHPFNADKKMAG